MNDWDKAYIASQKSKEIESEDNTYTFGYITGCAFAFIF